ncbi:dTMP kinase [Paenibacillus zanthoxyli]|uniref:dTMP kinase n=1 Tax=Paenibacillus zanthoxyli TaxID=369399 RepID=UPI0004717420|nr:deoxynucleoside kinase [Paenibacillus zanthoxyli]
MIDLKPMYTSESINYSKEELLGNLITFSGLDGSGKTTQTELLLQELGSKNTIKFSHKITQNEEFYITLKYLYQHSKKIDQKYISYLIAFEYLQFFINTVIYNLKLGNNVILDRNVFDLYIEQRYMFSNDFEHGWDMLNSIMSFGVNIYLEICPSEAYERILSRGKAVKEHEKIENLTVRKRGYDLLVSNENIHVFDASRSKEVIHQEIMELLKLKYA